MAPSSDYALPGGGGRLKLKGVQGGRVEKKKKKKKAKDKDPELDNDKELADNDGLKNSTEARDSRSRSRSVADADSKVGDEQPLEIAKTEAERRYEEARKKRVRTSPY